MLHFCWQTINMLHSVNRRPESCTTLWHHEVTDQRLSSIGLSFRANSHRSRSNKMFAVTKRHISDKHYRRLWNSCHCNKAARTLQLSLLSNRWRDRQIVTQRIFGNNWSPLNYPWTILALEISVEQSVPLLVYLCDLTGLLICQSHSSLNIDTRNWKTFLNNWLIQECLLNTLGLPFQFEKMWLMEINRYISKKTNLT